jgi:glycosyltransferase involved in cell wall biosynthesis
MNILRIISSINPDSGGPIEGLKQSSLALVDLGHTIHVACLDSSDDPWIENFPFRVYPLGPASFKYAFSKNLVPWLKSNACQYDCIIVEGIWQYASFGTWRALRHSSIPYFVYTHGMLDPWFKHTYPLKHLKKWLYWPWSEYRVLKDAKAVLFTTEEERQLARQSFWLYQCNEEVINFGTSAPGGIVQQQHEVFWQRFPNLRGKRIFLFLGRIHPKKGCDLLISAFAKVSHLDDTLHLVIVGPDQVGWKSKLQQQILQLGIHHRVTWAGSLAGDVKLGALRTAELFVLPSHQENFGISVVEALSCGLPVLISNKVNIWREIQAGQAGLVSNDNDADLVIAMNQWIGLSPQDQHLMAQNAQQCFLKHFEVTQAASSLLDVLRYYGVKG